VDSSTLVALAARDALGGGPIKTYFTMLDGDSAVPRAWARKVAQQYATDHAEIVVRPAEVAQDIDAIVYHLDEPYGGSIAPWFVFRSMAKDVRVAISGLGGDELFGNYGKWRTGRLPGDTSAAARARERAAVLVSQTRGRFHDGYVSDAFKRERL